MYSREPAVFLSLYRPFLASKIELIFQCARIIIYISDPTSSFALVLKPPKNAAIAMISDTATEPSCLTWTISFRPGLFICISYTKSENRCILLMKSAVSSEVPYPIVWNLIDWLHVEGRISCTQISHWNPQQNRP